MSSGMRGRRSRSVRMDGAVGLVGGGDEKDIRRDLLLMEWMPREVRRRRI
jgi:hypothetical protein